VLDAQAAQAARPVPLELGLEPLVREQFILAVPFAPLCKDDCLGLCPTCGIDKNVESCACEKPIDPRFAALQGLKLPPS
jgi:uncharacterized protein